ncbi:MAG: hypothetical protein ABSG03_22710 [Bryobacteraceae bacterium]|jgi:putative intracellular protease/amidase
MNDKVIGALCHGSIALANKPARIRGRRVTGYTREEDALLERRLVGSGITVPRFPEKTLESAGRETTCTPLSAIEDDR